MKLPDIAAVDTLAERELDALLYVHLFHGEYDGLRSRPEFVEQNSPHFSASEGPSFFAMVAKVREKGWWIEIELLDGWHVRLITSDSRPPVKANGDTLPLAFARAAVKTCCKQKEAS